MPCTIRSAGFLFTILQSLQIDRYTIKWYATYTTVNYRNMTWNPGNQGVSPKKKQPRKKPAKRVAAKRAMLAERAAKKKRA